MKKIAKIVFITLIIASFCLCFNCNSFASSRTEQNNTTNNTESKTNNINRTNTTNQNATSNNNQSNSINTSTSQNTIENTSTSTTVTNADDINDGKLGFSSILSILLISVGVVIIFLAIAILIRLK